MSVCPAGSVMRSRVLLALASGKFEVFITTDQRISYQQAISRFAAGWLQNRKRQMV
jgi:hypothetical protein